MNQLEKKISSYITGLIFIFGSLSNVIVFLVYSRKRLNRISASFFFKAIAFNDIILLIQELRHFLKLTFNKDLKLDSDFSCKILMYMTYATPAVSTWIMVYLSFERYLSIKYLKKFNFRKYFKVKVFILLSIYTVNYMFYIPVSIFETITKNNQSKMCDLNESYQKFTITSMNLVFSTLLPFSIMFIFSALIINYLIKSGPNYKLMRASSEKTRLRKDVQFSITLIIHNLFFLLAYLPVVTLDFFINLEYDFLHYILYNLVYLNCDAKIIIHFTMNDNFRRELIRILGFSSRRIHVLNVMSRDTLVRKDKDTQIA